MVEIVDGIIVKDELTKNARGGTELMAQRLVSNVDSDLLKGVQIIFSRPKELKEGYKKVLYLHDLPEDPAISQFSSADFRNQFDLIVFVSAYQRHRFRQYFACELDERMIVIPNAIEPIPFKPKQDDGKIRIIYHTTPHRGLELLVPVFINLSNYFPNIELSVFSSFDIYGWGDRDNHYKPLFDLMAQYPNIHYSKSVSNEQIREELVKADIFCLPSIWEETSCLALMEAMSANLFCVHSDYGALPETGCGLTAQYNYFTDKEQHLRSLNSALGTVLQEFQRPKSALISKVVIDNFRNLNRYKYMWQNVLTQNM